MNSEVLSSNKNSSNNFVSRVLFVGVGFGTEKDLLYWGSISSAMVRGGASVVFASQRTIIPENLPSGVEFWPKLSRFKILDALKAIWRGRNCNAVFVVEFSLFSFVASLLAVLLGKRKNLVLLVENHPRYLAGYGLNRQRLVDILYRASMMRLFTNILTNNVETKAYIEKLASRIQNIKSAPYLTSNFDGQPSLIRDQYLNDKNIIEVILVGQLIQRKGFSILIETIASNQIKMRGKFTFKICGDGPLRKNLTDLAVARGVNDMVEFLGSVPYTEVVRVFDHGDIFLSSTLADYRSLVSFEAVSRGLPVIISRFDGAANEVVDIGSNGFIYDPFQPASLIDSLDYLWHHKSDLSSFRARSLEISSSFTLEKAVDNLMSYVR